MNAFEIALLSTAVLVLAFTAWRVWRRIRASATYT